MKPSIYAEIRKGLVRYYYVIKSSNGQVLTTSEKYYSKWNCRRAAIRAGYLVVESSKQRH